MKKVVFYGLATLLTVVFFTYLIPVDTFEQFPVLLTFVATIVSTVFLAITIFSIPFEMTEEEEKNGSAWGYVYFIAIAGFLFGYGIFLLSHHSDRVSKEINDYGVYTVGIVIGGESLKTRKIDNTHVVVKFIDENGNTQRVKHSLSSYEFENMHRSQYIPIVYSKNYPELIRVLKNNSEIAYYSKLKIRNLEINDLIDLLDETNGKVGIKKLNSFSQRWKINNRSYQERIVYENVLNQSVIQRENNKITAVFSGRNFEKFEDEIFKLGFLKMDNGNMGILYENEKYLLHFYFDRKLSLNNRDDFGSPMKESTIITLTTKKMN
jgi:hypothetical protein